MRRGNLGRAAPFLGVDKVRCCTLSFRGAFFERDVGISFFALLNMTIRMVLSTPTRFFASLRMTDGGRDSHVGRSVLLRMTLPTETPTSC